MKESSETDEKSEGTLERPYNESGQNKVSTGSSIPIRAVTPADEQEDHSFEQEDELEIMLMKNPEYTMVIQEEGVVGYYLKGALKNSEDPASKYKSSRSLRKNPPVLELFVIEKETGEVHVTDSLLLSAELTEALFEQFRDLNLAFKDRLYTGSDDEIKSWWNNTREYFASHKIKTFIVFMVCVVILLGLFVL